MNRKLKWLFYTFLILIIIGMICVFTGSTYYHSLLLESAIKKSNVDKTVKLITKYPETINHLPTIMPRWWRVLCDYDHTVKYPLDCAVDNGQVEIVEILLVAGASSKESFFAIVCGNNADIAFMLIERGFVDVSGPEGIGALKNSVRTHAALSEEERENMHRLFD